MSKDWREVEKPPGVAALETDPRGYPIFVAIQPPPGQALDFRVLNVRNHLRIARENLCAICGNKNGYWLDFVGGPMCLKGPGGDAMREAAYASLDSPGAFAPPGPRRDAHGIFGDGPMHPDCARYALAVCPFLTIPRMRYSETPSKTVPDTTMDANVITEKPRLMVVLRTRGFKLVPAPGGKPVFKTNPPKAVEWRGQDGKPMTEGGAG